MGLTTHAVPEASCSQRSHRWEQQSCDEGTAPSKSLMWRFLHTVAVAKNTDAFAQLWKPNAEYSHTTAHDPGVLSVQVLVGDGSSFCFLGWTLGAVLTGS